MPVRKLVGPHLASPKKATKTTTVAAKEDDLDISDTESYFSSKYEPEYLTRLTIAVANGAERRRNRSAGRPFCHHIRAVKHTEHINDGPASPAPTVSTFSLKSGETGFRYLVSEEVDESRQNEVARRTDSPKDRPAAQFTRRQRSNSEASDALPQIQAPAIRQHVVDYDDLDSDSDCDSLKSLEAGFLNPSQRRRAQYDGQRCASPSQRLRGFALRPSKSTVNISSPALANRLGVPMRAELEVWIDELKNGGG